MTQVGAWRVTVKVRVPDPSYRKSEAEQTEHRVYVVVCEADKVQATLEQAMTLYQLPDRLWLIESVEWLSALVCWDKHIARHAHMEVETP